MKVSESWLSEWVNTPLKTEALAEKLTMAGLEVDEISPASGAFTHVVVAHVIETRAHPKADKLTVCTVDVGEQHPVQIVCGASNVRAQLKVALARPGADLPGGIHIEETALRGELSAGMICSSPELGLEDAAEGILELPDDAPIGTALQDYLLLNDNILMIELTPNRADCFSMRGVAREVSALTDADFKAPLIQAVPEEIAQRVDINIAEKAACPGYALRLIQGVSASAATPLWMKERLRRAGVRPIHPVVDITQYVMLEFGQPMHAFDASKVSGAVQVRLSKKGEQLILLDGQSVTFDAGVLLIADDEKPLAIAGVMGGLESSVGPDTVNILFESAFFEPRQIAGVARAYGLCTDASQRFERGVDPALHREIIERATTLLQDIAGGKAGPVVWEHTVDYLPNISIAFNPIRVLELTGLDVPLPRMQRMLEALGMQVVITADVVWQVQVPSYRFDIALDVDLVEEIARLYGYDALTPTTSSGALRPGALSVFHQTSRMASACLSARGYHEIISYSFVDPTLQAAFYPDADTLNLLNPLSSELSEMRVSLWPGLIAALLQNLSRQQTTVRCFETGVVFDVQAGVLSERASLAGLLMGETGALHWATPTRAYDFYDMKGDLEALFASASASLRFVPDDSMQALHPSKSARLYIEEQAIGWMGVLHPALSEAFGIDADVMLFEIKLDALEEAKHVGYQAISKYPQVRRDLSLLVDDGVPAAHIEQAVRSSIADDIYLLKAFHLFDQYTGEQVPEGKKSLAIALIFQDAKLTLTEQEIMPLIESVIHGLESALAIQVRDGA
ncbi:MAG: phenylalanine--tRNA ligase subunit beta [Gammaproteobacteria bacterium]|nr:phenylalanine--tRNA ligase subunit beta [Gammaproteobacteria bacterium]MCH9763138.1 phenylalanine--tRNA ligase subunit beta [Gammaproteobacteria bacterium]